MIVICSFAPIAKSTEQISEHLSQVFVKDIGNEIISILVNKSKTLPQRKQHFKRVLEQNFGMRSIGKFVLARYWRRMNEAQQAEYIQLFKNSLVNTYAAQFDNYANERLEVFSSRATSDGGVIVNSKILRPAGGAPLLLDWKVFNTKNGLKIFDIVVNGVSMSITMRSEYAGIIRTTGGKVNGLLKHMRHQVSG